MNIPRYLGALALLLLGCSLVAAMDEKTAAVAVGPDLTGEWSGTWQSCTSGHNGPLKATFCKTDDCHYQVKFRGRFWKVFPFRYTAVLDVTGQDKDKVHLGGSRKLPFFGEFSYTATATACEFHADYCTKKDNGTFTMTRCGH
jgi:hypothetical protein